MEQGAQLLGRSHTVQHPVCEVCGASEDIKRCSGCQSVYYCGKDHQAQHRGIHKALCKICSSDKPTVLIIGNVGYFDVRDDWLIQKLKPQLQDLAADVRAVGFATEACTDLLLTGRVAAVVVSALQHDDPNSRSSQFCEDAAWLAVLKSWVGRGGHLFFMAGEGSRLLALFDKTFGRKWTHKGDFYRRTEHELCAADVPPAVRAQLPETYNVKACMLTGVAAEEALYMPGNDATVISAVPVPGFDGAPIQAGQCGVAVAAEGRGRLIYCGDVNCEGASVDILKAFVRVGL